MLIIDRFEGDFAVVETDNGLINISLSDMPKDSKEGDTLRLIIDEEDTAVRKKRIDRKMERLFKG